MRYILAPHLDDEVIGCFHVLDTIDRIFYFTDDYRVDAIKADPRYSKWEADSVGRIVAGDTVFVPSRFDLHPLHHLVRRIGLLLPARLMYYSVEMNTPWLEEELRPREKEALFRELYPRERERLVDHKYWLFRSVQPFDEITWASVGWKFEEFHAWEQAPDEVGFLRFPHRHIFHVRARVQQFEGDRELEYFILRAKVRDIVNDMLETKWERPRGMSCEAAARHIKRQLEITFPDRLVRVSLYEDGENGCDVE
jgi:hypothetical protein